MSNKKKVPPSIYFDRELLLVPTLSIGGITDLTDCVVCTPMVEIGDWVDRGDVLLTATVHNYRKAGKPWFQEDPWDKTPIILRSPVSGLVLDQLRGNGAYYMEGRPGFNFGTVSCFPALLLPKHEPPQNCQEMRFYSSLRSVLAENLETLVRCSDRDLGYSRLKELSSEAERGNILERFRGAKTNDKFEVRAIRSSDHLQHNIDGLRSYDLILRDKLLHLAAQSNP